MTDHQTPPQAWPGPPLGSLEVAPIFCNVFTMIATPAVIRIAFGEAFGTSGVAPAMTFHTAVALTQDDAKNLVRSLAGLLQIPLAPEPHGG